MRPEITIQRPNSLIVVTGGRRNRGVHARTGYPTSVRYSKLELLEIEDAAENCGLSRSDFLRYVTLEVARQINNGTGDRSKASGAANPYYEQSSSAD